MSLDFLRNLAFDGELRNFFTEDYYDLGSRSTGIHLRFDERFLRAIASWRRVDDEFQTNWYETGTFGSNLGRALDDFRLFLDGQPKSEFESFWPYISSEFRDNPRRVVQILVDVKSAMDPLLSDGPREYEGFPILYRQMGPIEAHYSQGSAIEASGKRGTICGFVEDANSNQYALTCGHVVSNVGLDVQDVQGRLPKLGTAHAIEVPIQSGNCNRLAEPAANGLDVALIDILANGAVSLGPARALEGIATISSGDFIEMHGQASRSRRSGMVMNATIWKQIDLYGDGSLYCCGDIFEISHRSTQYVNSPFSRPGDSGAAVVRPGPGGNWLGMLIGGHRASSFVSYAEHIMDWADTVLPQVRVVP